MISLVGTSTTINGDGFESQLGSERGFERSLVWVCRPIFIRSYSTAMPILFDGDAKLDERMANANLANANLANARLANARLANAENRRLQAGVF